MRSFKQFVQEQKAPPKPVKIPTSDPAVVSVDPRDMKVIEAFFDGIPDVMGTNIITKQDDAADFNNTDLRIDLLFIDTCKFLISNIIIRHFPLN